MRFTLKCTGTIFLDTRHIVSATPHAEGGTVLTMRDGSWFWVEETY